MDIEWDFRPATRLAKDRIIRIPGIGRGGFPAVEGTETRFFVFSPVTVATTPPSMIILMSGRALFAAAQVRIVNKPLIIVGMSLLGTAWWSPTLQAQGTIFGVVRNADLSTPGTNDVRWVGFLDNTDEEIRIETNVGSGYESGNWFDDFQNYTTEAAGNPYDFHFVNTANGQALRHEGPIPDNSFQQEDVQLAVTSVPAQPTGLTGAVIATATVRLSWGMTPGLSYHVYRRDASNNSVYRRLDDPTGNLGNPGVADSFFIDAATDGVTDYTYLLIAEDDAGNWSAHSEELTISSGGDACACDCFGDPQCDGTVNVFDVVLATGVAFRSEAPIPDPNPQCPLLTTDVDCSGATNVFDVVRFVDVAFRNGDIGDAFCNPCAH